MVINTRNRLSKFIIFFCLYANNVRKKCAYRLIFFAQTGLFCAIYLILCNKINNMKETLSSISSRTGFSITTVSRVLSGQSAKYRISDKTRDLILEEAKRCDYSPNIIAQNLRASKTNTIGVLMPSVSNPYFSIPGSL